MEDPNKLGLGKPVSCGSHSEFLGTIDAETFLGAIKPSNGQPFRLRCGRPSPGNARQCARSSAVASGYFHAICFIVTEAATTAWVRTAENAIGPHSRFDGCKTET